MGSFSMLSQREVDPRGKKHNRSSLLCLSFKHELKSLTSYKLLGTLRRHTSGNDLKSRFVSVSLQLLLSVFVSSLVSINAGA